MSARGVGLLAALGVRILDAQDEAPAVVAREQPAEQRGARVAEMQLARGTGCETGGDGAVGHRRILRESDRRAAASVESPRHEKLTSAARHLLGLSFRSRPRPRHRARARHHQPRRIRHRTAARPRAADRGKFPGLRARRALHQHAVPSRDRELRDPGRRRRHRLQGQAHAEAHPERSRQWPQESARHRGPGARRAARTRATASST